MLPFQTIQRQFAEAIRDPSQVSNLAVPGKRLQIYQSLFFNNMSSFLSTLFPVLKAITDENRWSSIVRDFMIRHQCRSPCFADIAKEFLRYLEFERDDDNDPGFMLELCHYEWVELALETQKVDEPQWAVNKQGDLLTGIPRLSPLAWPLCYTYPVHEISVQYQPVAPPETTTCLVACRNDQDTVTFTVINSLTLRLLTLIQANTAKSGETLLLGLAKELQHPQPDVVIASGLEILKTLQANGAILGTCPG